MRGLGILAVGAVALALAMSGLAGAASILLDPLTIDSDFTVSPKALPKRTPAPAGLEFSERFPTAFASGAPAPASKEIVLLLDRNIDLDLDGHPVCASNGLESQSLPAAPLPNACKKAILGRGSSSFLIRFPDAEPVTQSSRVLLINGRRSGGMQTLYVHMYLTVPVPAVIVTTVKVKPIRKGRYGTEATFTIPKVAGGSGLLTNLRFKLDKRFRRDDRKVSVVNAKCPDGKLQTSTVTAFADGTRAEDSLVKPCTPRDG